MKKITIYEYFAHNCPADSYNVISKDGDYRRPQSTEELEGQLKDYVNKNGEKAYLLWQKSIPILNLSKWFAIVKLKRQKQKRNSLMQMVETPIFPMHKPNKSILQR